MKSGYGEFCPIAKASEIFATRWTPLVLRELMLGAHSFNDIHRGVPLMSRTLLSERLRHLEETESSSEEFTQTIQAVNTG